MNMLVPLFDALEAGPALWSWLALIAAFAALAKCADVFVDSACGIAVRLNVPKLMVGIVLVSVATTAPELSVSLMAALRGNPEMALGNAVGSVICNCGIALALCGIFSRLPVPVMRPALKTAGGFLVLTGAAAFIFVARDGTLGRIEGGALLLGLAAYLGFLVRQYRIGGLRETLEADIAQPARSLPMLLALFFAGLAGVVFASKFVVVASVRIAVSLGIPEAVIALTLVALGTSIPEVATSVVAAIKGQGALSVGNILGANIMNICWVAGASAVFHPLSLSPKQIFFMFPSMFVMVAVTLVVLHTGAALSRREGIVLAVVYLGYLLSFGLIFP